MPDPNEAAAGTAQTASEAGGQQATAQTATEVAGTTEKPSLINEGQTKPDGEKPAEGEQKPGETPPNEYTDFKLPEGIEVAPEQMTEFKALAKELGLPQEGAQKLLDQHAKILQDAAVKPYKEWQTTQQKWVDEVKADKEVGGDKLPEVQRTVARVLDQYGGKELRDALDFTGAGNNPAIIKAFYRMAVKLTEGGFVAGAPAAEQKPQPGPQAMYPNLPVDRAR